MVGYLTDKRCLDRKCFGDGLVKNLAGWSDNVDALAGYKGVVYTEA